MNKMISKILSFIMIINAIFLNVVPVFGAPKIQPRATDGATGFEWNTQAILNEKLEIIERPSDSQEVLLTWNVDKINDKPITSISYKLEYAIADAKGVELNIIKKTNDEIEIEYKVNKDSSVNKGNKILNIYKDGNYIEANKNSLPSGVELINTYPTGLAKNVKFKIKKNSGLSFKYQNTTIKIQYDKNGKLNFVTDGIERGIIYPFRLSYTENGNKKEIDKRIFTGLKISGVKPFANANGSDKGKETIDQTQNKTEFPGGDVVGVDITFDFPKDWNTTNKKFEVDAKKSQVKAVFSIGHLEESKKIQISIEDIYKNGNGSNIKVVNKDGSTSKITASYSTNTDKATITLKNLESSTMYSDVSVSAERSTDSFETIAAIYPVGTVYTYPAYRVIALGVKEYYLEIEPFRGYNGFYVISKGDLSSSMSKWSTYEDKKNGKSKILISLPLNALTEQEKYFKVNFSFTPPDLTTNDFKFTSQILKFKPSKDDIVLSTPKNFKIVESNIVKGDDGKENLFLSLKWDIDYESVLEYLIDKNGTNGTGSTGKTLDITYNFSQGLVPEEIDTSFASVKLNLTKNGSLNQNGKDKIDIKYENAGSTSGTNSITIVESKCRTTTRVETSANEVNKIYEANVTFKIPVSQRNSGTKDVLQYPNTYFVAVKGEHKINGGNQPYITGDSLPVTLTLDGITNIEIATPQNLNVLKDSIDKNEFAMQYDTLNYKEEGDALYSYNEIMLKTLGKEMNDNSVKYDFYITQRKDLLDKMTEAGTEEKLDPTVKNKIKTVEYSKVTTLNTQSGDPAKYTFDFSGNQEMLTHLRSDGIVQITNIPQNFEKLDTGKINPKQELSFKGLDENQTYYIIARTGVTPVETKMPSQPAPQPPAPPAPAPTPPTTLKEEFSRFSKIVSVTTIDKTQKPTDNEKVPPAPINFKAEDISLNSANLVWDRVIENISEEETGASGNGKSGKADDKADTTPKEPSSYLEYQFIKVPKQQLSDEFLKSKNSFEKTWQDLSDVKEKYGLQTSKDKILEFNKDSKKFEETKPERYQYLLPDGKQGKIADKILSPNEIYFYYIRTVRMAKPQGQSSSSSYEPVAYSVWVPLSFTTKNVTPPVNLRVEPNAKYNKENEVVISFDIPKMNHDLIGKEYDIQYSIKEDLGEWTADKTMPVNDITIVDNVDGKTMKVTYKITGLKSGKIYTIRVRLFNKLLNISSMYSNEVEHRTDSNNGDNDYDQTVGNWNDNFKEKIEQLKNQSYWYIKDTSKETIVYYRPQYFDTIANAANGSLIPLVSGSGGAYKEYYLPASTLVKAFDQGKGFKISYKTSEVILSPKFLNTEVNETIKNLKQELNKKGSGTKDYFVKVIIEFKDGKYVINGLDSLSPVAKININIVTTKDTIAEFDQKMYTYINEMLSTTEFSTDIKTAIGNLISKNKTNAEMVVEVEKMVDRFKTKFGDRLSKEMSNLVIKTIPLKYVDSDIIVTYPVASGINGLGYKKSGSNWVSADTREYLGKKAIFTREAGEYIFAGKKLVINGLGNLSNAEQITNVVIKYGLDDYLGKNSNINIKAPMTRNMTIGCLARLAGATKTQNPIEFFKSKGIVISTRNEDSNISQEEAVYLIMKVYEIKTGTKMDTIKIKNYNQTSGIKNINKNYKKAVQVAFQTGIYNNPNMNAKGTLSTQDFLTSITKMATMLDM